MKRVLLSLLVLAGVALTQEAFSQTYVNVRIGTPPPRRVVYARPMPPPQVVYAPVYVAPRPAVIVRPAPVVMVPAYRVYGHPGYGRRHGYRRW